MTAVKLMLVFANGTMSLANDPLTCRKDILKRVENISLAEYELFIAYLNVLGEDNCGFLTNSEKFSKDDKAKFTFETVKLDLLSDHFSWYFGL